MNHPILMGSVIFKNGLLYTNNSGYSSIWSEQLTHNEQVLRSIRSDRTKNKSNEKPSKKLYRRRTSKQNKRNNTRNK